MNQGTCNTGLTPNGLREFENIKSQDEPVLNKANNKTLPLYSGDYPESVVLESSAMSGVLADTT